MDEGPFDNLINASKTFKPFEEHVIRQITKVADVNFFSAVAEKVLKRGE